MFEVKEETENFVNNLKQLHTELGQILYIYESKDIEESPKNKKKSLRKHEEELLSHKETLEKLHNFFSD